MMSHSALIMETQEGGGKRTTQHNHSEGHAECCTNTSSDSHSTDDNLQKCTVKRGCCGSRLAGLIGVTLFVMCNTQQTSHIRQIYGEIEREVTQWHSVLSHRFPEAFLKVLAERRRSLIDFTVASQEFFTLQKCGTKVWTVDSKTTSLMCLKVKAFNFLWKFLFLPLQRQTECSYY